MATSYRLSILFVSLALTAEALAVSVVGQAANLQFGTGGFTLTAGAVAVPITGKSATLTASAPPTWAPSAGNSAAIGYARGTHPSSLPATLEEISTQYQTWNPSAPAVGPWGGVAAYPFTTIMAFGGGCWAPSVRKWIGYGAGHVAVNVPVPFAFDEATLSWQWLDTPPPSDGLALSGTALAADIAAAYPAGQIDSAWAEWQGGYSGWTAGYERPGKIFPEPGHSRYGLLFIPGAVHGNTNGAVLLVISSTGKNSGGDVQLGHYFDIDSNAWARTTNRRAASGTSAVAAIFFGGSVNRAFALCHSSSTNKSALDVYQPSGKTWSVTNATAAVPLSVEGGGMGAHLTSSLLLFFAPERADGTAAFDGVRHRVYAVDAATAAAGSHTWTRLTVSAASWPVGADSTIGRIGWSYCPDNGCFYAINAIDSSATLWKLSPPSSAVTQADHLSGTWTVTTETLGTAVRARAANGSGSGSSTYNRLTWDAASKCFLWVEDYNQARVQAIHPAGV